MNRTREILRRIQIKRQLIQLIEQEISDLECQLEEPADEENLTC